MNDRESLDLPPVQMAMLDGDTVDQLFFDLGAVAELLDVRVKAASGEHAAEGPRTLAEAHGVLVSGAALGVQLRYVHAGLEWMDTLLRVADGVQLVRMEVPLRSRA